MAYGAPRVTVEDGALLGCLPCWRFVLTFTFKDVITQVHAFVTDVDGRTGNQFAYLILILSTKGTDKLRLCGRVFFVCVRISCHYPTSCGLTFNLSERRRSPP